MSIRVIAQPLYAEQRVPKMVAYPCADGSVLCKIEYHTEYIPVAQEIIFLPTPQPEPRRNYGNDPLKVQYLSPDEDKMTGKIPRNVPPNRVVGFKPN